MVLLKALQLLLELAPDQQGDDHRQSQHHERDQDDDRTALDDVERRVDLREDQEDHQEDRERRTQLPFQVGIAEEQALAEIGERDQQKQVEDDALDHVAGRRLCLWIDTRLIRPRLATQGVERVVVAVPIGLKGHVDVVTGDVVQAGSLLVGQDIVDDAVFGEFLETIIVQVPHILRDPQGRVVDRPVPHGVVRVAGVRHSRGVSEAGRLRGRRHNRLPGHTEPRWSRPGPQRAVLPRGTTARELIKRKRVAAGPESMMTLRRVFGPGVENSTATSSTYETPGSLPASTNPYWRGVPIGHAVQDADAAERLQ